ncbi:MAG: hypothetical protein RIR18_488 [Pseudomonadota bacterium]|jgi:hypothetical protein
MPRHDRVRSQVTRTQLASTAARLMAQDGITDYTTAKKKAARQLGLSEHIELPDDTEVEAELRLYQALYQHDEHPGLLRSLRETARDVMQMLDRYRPYLTGSVLDGTAGEQAEIDLQIFADSAKEVEIFLLDQGIEFEHATPRNEKAEAVLVLSTDVADVNLVIYPSQVERISFKYRDGRPRERIRLPALETLLRESTAANPSHTTNAEF